MKTQFCRFTHSMLCLFAILPLLFTSAFAQTAQPPDWENPQLTGINNELPHATFLPFDNEKDALKNDWTASPFYMLLNGTWKFNWSETPEKRPVDFFRDGYEVGAWKDIQVPSTIEIQGYGYPVYVNQPYEFKHLMKPDPPKVPHDYNPVGSYRRDFEIPGNWDGREVFLHFGAVKSFCYVYLNGQLTGYCVKCKKFVYLHWTLEGSPALDPKAKKVPQPKSLGTVWDSQNGQSLAIYACPHCAGPFAEIKSKADLKNCPSCNKPDFAVDETKPLMAID